MCQSKSQGGKRCEYSEAYNNEKKRVIRALTKEDPLLQQESPHFYYRAIQLEMDAFLQKNPDFARARLPKHPSFECNPRNKRSVPEGIAADLQNEREKGIAGLPEDDRVAETKALYEEMKAYEAQWSEETQVALKVYTMNHYLPLNAILRGPSYLKEYLMGTPEGALMSTEEREHYAKVTAEKFFGVLDKAFELVPEDAPVRKTYRLYQVPPGIKPEEYIEHYFNEGDGYHEKAYMSTSADPEFITGLAMRNSDFQENKKYIAIEVVSNKGISLQPKETSTAGHIQSKEKEVLLPRGMKFRIAGINTNQTFRFTTDRSDVVSYSDGEGIIPPGTEYTIPTIQLVDESLI